MKKYAIMTLSILGCMTFLAFASSITHYQYNDYFWNSQRQLQYWLPSEGGVDEDEASIKVFNVRYNITDSDGTTHLTPCS